MPQKGREKRRNEPGDEVPPTVVRRAVDTCQHAVDSLQINRCKGASACAQGAAETGAAGRADLGSLLHRACVCGAESRISASVKWGTVHSRLRDLELLHITTRCHRGAVARESKLRTCVRASVRFYRLSMTVCEPPFPLLLPP